MHIRLKRNPKRVLSRIALYTRKYTKHYASRTYAARTRMLSHSRRVAEASCKGEHHKALRRCGGKGNCYQAWRCWPTASCAATTFSSAHRLCHQRLNFRKVSFLFLGERTSRRPASDNMHSVYFKRVAEVSRKYALRKYGDLAMACYSTAPTFSSDRRLSHQRLDLREVLFFLGEKTSRRPATCNNTHFVHCTRVA